MRIPLHVCREVICSTQRHVATHYRLDVLGNNVEVFGSAADKGVYNLSSEVGNVECHVDRPHDLLERYALHARHEEGPSQGALEHPEGL